MLHTLFTLAREIYLKDNLEKMRLVLEKKLPKQRKMGRFFANVDVTD